MLTDVNRGPAKASQTKLFLGIHFLPRSTGCVVSNRNPAAKRGCHHWSVGDVVAFLHQLELGHVEELFRTNGVDGDMLKDMSEDDLRTELGLTRLQARKVQRRFGLLLASDA